MDQCSLVCRSIGIGNPPTCREHRERKLTHCFNVIIIREHATLGKYQVGTIPKTPELRAYSRA